jgi:hypothetical protein
MRKENEKGIVLKKRRDIKKGIGPKKKPVVRVQ